MDASWANRFKDFPITQAWPDEETLRRHQSFPGRFTAQGQFKDGISPYPLMPGSVASRRDFEHMITGYDASIAYIDHHMRIVLDELDKQKVLDDAVLIVSSDHGDAFGEHGIYSDHICADECIHHIPLIIRWPGVAARNQACSSLLYNVDLAPTLCELLGIPPVPDWDGSSFAANVKGLPGFDREYLVWDTGLYTVQRCVRTKTHLLIRTYDTLGYRFEPVEIYDLVSDPYQTRNLRGERPDIVQICSGLLADWQQQQWMKGHVIPDPVVEVLRERSNIADSVARMARA